MDDTSPHISPDAVAIRHQRSLLALAGVVYGAWWLVVRGLLPSSYNPLGGRLAVCALFFATLLASFHIELVRRRVERFYGVCACALLAHYYYLFYNNTGDPNWIAGAYVTVLAVGVTIEWGPSLVAFALIAFGGTWLAESHDPANLVAIPGTVTVLILINMVGFLRRKSDHERRARLEAEAKRAVAEAASRMRFHFLANMSHELRTPLTSIAGFSDLLADAPELSDDSREVLARVRANTRMLSDIVVQILTLTESDLAPITLRGEAFSVREELAAILRLHDEAVAVRGLIVRIDVVEPFDEIVVADRKQWRRVVDAVVANAVKFTAKGRIVLTARRAGRHLTVDIADTGVGIDRAEWEHCFDAFRQIREDYTRPYGGAGLGLTVARRIARAMGGDVTIIASALGQGTTVRVDVAVEGQNPAGPGP